MRRKITYITTGLARAGAEMQLMLLCERFVKAGWEVGLISLLPPVAFADELERMGVPLVSLNLSKRLPDPRAFVRLVHTLRQWSPDVLHCHQVHANLAGRAARVFTEIPVVICTAHSIQEGPRWREWAYRLTDSLCDLTTNVCQAGVDRYLRVGAAPAGKICHVPNAIDVERFAFDTGAKERVRAVLGLTDEFTWLAVGNLRAPKDYPTMLEAFRQVCVEKPAAKLLIAGAGPLQTALEGSARDKGLSGVRFLGARDDVADLMCAADGFLMSSSWEGMPLALLEAAASGLPVVATRVGGVAEIVVEGQSGFLAASHNPGELARGCLDVMNLPFERRMQFGQAGRRRVEAAFSIDAVVNKWQEIYAEIWQQKQRHLLARGTA